MAANKTQLRATFRLGDRKMGNFQSQDFEIVPRNVCGSFVEIRGDCNYPL